MLINIQLYFLFLLLSLGQLGRISFLGQQINWYLFEIVLLVTSFILFFRYKFEPWLQIAKNWKSAIFFLGALVLSLVISLMRFSLIENVVAALYLARIFLYFSYFFYLGYHAKKYPKTKKHLFNSFLVFVCITLVTSLVQYFLYPNLRNLIYEGWDPHLYRMFGLFFDTSIASAVYGLIFLTTIFIFDKFKKHDLFAWIILITSGGGILLSFSRTVYIVLLVITGIYLLFKKNFTAIAVLFLLFLTALVIVPKPFGEGVNLTRSFSVLSRLQDYKNAFKIMSKHPFFGAGYNHIRYEKRKMNLIESANFNVTHSGASFHSSFLILAAGAGLIGLLSFLILLARFVSLSTGVAVLTLFLSGLSLSDNILLHPFILLIFLSITILITPLFGKSR